MVVYSLHPYFQLARLAATATVPKHVPACDPDRFPAGLANERTRRGFTAQI